VPLTAISRDSGTRGRLLADAIADRMIASVPFRLSATRDPREVEEVQRLRAETIVEMGWAPAERYPEGIEFDSHDERAIQVGAWKDGDLVATSRVVPPGSDGRLPIEADFGLELSRRGELVEVGRTLVVPAYRGDGRHALLLALFAQCWREMRAIGYGDLVASAPPRLMDVYRSVGFEIEVLGPARRVWGEERYPVRFDVPRSAEAMAPTWLARD
jgi:N-acyl-L-homoserine lactone synthetase